CAPRCSGAPARGGRRRCNRRTGGSGRRGCAHTAPGPPRTGIDANAADKRRGVASTEPCGASASRADPGRWQAPEDADCRSRGWGAPVSGAPGATLSDLEVERALVGWMLTDCRLAGRVDPEWFTDPLHANIARALRGLD